MKKNTILLIGPQSTSSKDLERFLHEDRLQVKCAVNRRQALILLPTEQPQMIVLDCDEHGVVDLTYCQKIRSLYSGLFILLSDMDNNHFQIFALDIGADASFPKSANPKLLAANIKSLLRRFSPPEPVNQLTFGSLIVDPSRRDAFIGDVAIHLSTIEFDLLWYLVQKPGSVVSRDEIHRKIYDAEYNGYDRSIDLYVSRIRQKIGDPLDSPNYLKTVRGVGYQFIGITDRKNN